MKHIHSYLRKRREEHKLHRGNAMTEIIKEKLKA